MGGRPLGTASLPVLLLLEDESAGGAGVVLAGGAGVGAVVVPDADPLAGGVL